MTVLVALEDVTFSYRRQTACIQSLTVSFTDGRTAAVTGASGAGKSTLLYIAGLMLRPESGKVRLVGHEFGTAPDDERARFRATNVGFVFQDALLDPALTAEENVLEGLIFTRRVTKEAREAAVKLLGELGLEPLIERRVSRISGGQGQRVALARALIKDPAILLADEPTGNLDDESSRIVLDALMAHGRRPGRATIIVTHDSRIAAQCDDHIALGASDSADQAPDSETGE